MRSWEGKQEELALEENDLNDCFKEADYKDKSL